MPVLSFVISLPVLGILLAACMPSSWSKALKYMVLAVLVGQGVLLIGLLAGQEPIVGATGFVSNWGLLYGVERWPWLQLFVGASNHPLWVHYFVGIDGLSVALVGLAWVVLLLGMVISWSIAYRTKAYWMLYLLLDTSIVGSLLSLDGVLFFIFLELTLVPVYFFVGIWGGLGGPRVATTFFLYAFVASIFIFFVGLGFPLSAVWKQLSIAPSFVQPGGGYPGVAGDIVSPIYTFDLVKIGSACRSVLDGWVWQEGEGTGMTWAFMMLLVAFLLKMGIFPLHIWLPATHVVVPTGISVVLAGIVLKLGAYGLLRMGYSIFPQIGLQMGPWVGLVGMVSSIYASFMVLATKDFKRKVAYTSVSHMGFVLLGIGSMTVSGITGGIYQSVSHGLISSVLFILAAVYARYKGHRQVDGYSGLAAAMPYYAAVCGAGLAAAMGLPGSSTFIAELLILLGTWSSPGYRMAWMGWMVVLALFLQVLYCVWTFQRLVGGKAATLSGEPAASGPGITVCERLVLGILLGGIVILGIFPGWLLAIIQQGVLSFFKVVLQIGQ